MKKRNSVIGSILALLLANFVSAYSYGSYFSIRDYLYSIDPQTMTLAVVFIVIFAFVFYSLSRMLKNSEGEPNVIIAAVIAFAIAAFAGYGINRSNFDITNLFYNIGISGDALIWIISIFAILFAFFLIKKFKSSGFFIISGIIIILIAIFTDPFKEGIVIGVGIIFLFIGSLIWYLRKDKIGVDGSETNLFGKRTRKYKMNKYIRKLKRKRKDVKSNWEKRQLTEEIMRIRRRKKRF